MKRFYDHLLGDRIRILRESKDPNCIYDLLEKHLQLPADMIKSTYEIKLDFIMNRIFISSNDYTAMYELFTYLNRFMLTFESVSQFELRIDMNVFINKIL